jgi:hypothetical protein
LFVVKIQLNMFRASSYKTVYLMTIGKPEAATAVYKLLMMGKRMPETC